MLERVAHESGVVFYRSPLLHRHGIPHAFSTRIGGVSPAPFDSLNLGNPSGMVQDEPRRIEENYARLMRAAGLDGRHRRRVFQVHGCEVSHVAGAQPAGEDVQADAMTTGDPACALSVRTADCVPILMANADGRFVSAIHAGWRGVVARIVSVAARRLRELGQDAGAPLLAAIGPSISKNSFEVGPDVAGAFRERFDEVVLESESRLYVDLRLAIRRQLLEAGLSDNSIDTTDRCTVIHRAEFFSHRRDRGVTGRMASVIGAVSR